MIDLCVYLFGTPTIEFRGAAVEIHRRKALALAAYLVVSQQPQSRDTIATLLWPDLDQDHARAALRRTLPSLTALGGENVVLADRLTVGLKRDLLWSDVSEFLALLAQTRSHDHAPDAVCEACIPLLEQAIHLYRDDFMAGFTLPDSAEYDEWQVVQREWLSRELAGMLRRLTAYHSARKAYDQASTYGRQWVERDPLNEQAHRALMQIYAASGRRADALRQYQLCVRKLDEELATPPEDETTDLYESIKASADSRVHPTTAGARETVGAMPPQPILFVGREKVLADLKQRMGVGAEPRPLTVMQGWPGVGKSTTVAALAHDPDTGYAFPDGVLWASLGQTPDLLAVLNTWAGVLRVRRAGPPASVEELSANITAALHDKRMLLIVDDIWQSEHAAPFRVGGQGCAMVMTTRLNDVAQALVPTSQDIYRMPLLTEEAGLELLHALTPETVARHPKEARTLVRDLEGLPLALQVAGRLLNAETRLGWGVADLLNDLRQGARLLAAQAPGDMVGAGRETTPTIAALLKRSTDSLDAQTRQQFADLALFVPKPATFGLAAMAVVWEVQDPKPIARLLVNRGMLEPVSGGRFQIHALLVLHARALQEAAQ